MSTPVDPGVPGRGSFVCKDMPVLTDLPRYALGDALSDAQALALEVGAGLADVVQHGNPRRVGIALFAPAPGTTAGYTITLVPDGGPERAALIWAIQATYGAIEAQVGHPVTPVPLYSHAGALNDAGAADDVGARFAEAELIIDWQRRRFDALTTEMLGRIIARSLPRTRTAQRVAALMRAIRVEAEARRRAPRDRPSHGRPSPQ